ncbi:hypothetical protein NE237_019417 [Protea cynaroides]|uniref:Uncharacterized protein n=1 Tax=Protea cynaroides TaxID=273540 RepID=A0A9Q0KBP0_9MAGN|nr:hypothetical protein NE237_019417 [Protea cynaroides]
MGSDLGEKTAMNEVSAAGEDGKGAAKDDSNGKDSSPIPTLIIYVVHVLACMLSSQLDTYGLGIWFSLMNNPSMNWFIRKKSEFWLLFSNIDFRSVQLLLRSLCYCLSTSLLLYRLLF